MNRKVIYSGLAVLALAAIAFASWQQVGGGSRYNGSLIDPPAPAADFTLSDQNGQSFNLKEQSGKVTLIFFGYTNCPDVCPITMTTYKQLHAELGKTAEQVRFVFVTVDPERDTAEQMKAYIEKFDGAIIGLTGSREELEPVWKSYGVFEDSHAHDGDDPYSVEQYDVDHSSRIYAIDLQGNWRLTYPADMDFKLLARDIRQLLN